jgi:thiol-disulfide isomerase/thioredoxin
MKFLIISLFSAFLLFTIIHITPSFAHTSVADNHSEASVKVIGVKMDAEWCGKCRVMNPKLDAIMPSFMNQPVLFVKFNMTTDFTTQQAGLLAKRMGLEILFEEHQGKTGYMVLLDAASGEILQILNSDLSEDALTEAISAYL